MAKIIRDIAGNPVPQYMKEDESAFEPVKGKNGGSNINAAAATKDFTLQNAATANGNGTSANLAGAYGSFAVQIKGITNATINFETSNDGGTTWDAIRGINQGTGWVAITATENGTYRFSVAGIKLFRARISDYASGTITALGTATVVAEPSQVNPISLTIR